ncbi:hypothetical protein R1T16_07630 [Flavobacterium sp. DG1-102-2]|uniref:hypothetical protein n=1 Tax=Flavobacterium sp. DG1-102-2 TaxID=3081663 RepID=UPI00294A61AA|nr:hypothetical protein [Flavobacterium sp. DG1-102-2]MDV6168292.1 hypothetical protein [Flavobacterium sp. DG1-102-2]
MKKYILIVFLIAFGNLKAQKIIEMHYEGVVNVDAFNDFGKDEPSTDAYGEFIFSPIEKKLVRYDRDKQTPGKDAYLMNEYIIDNSAFLINGLNTIKYFNNVTSLLNAKGEVAGKIEYNPETKILAMTEWTRGNVVTYKYQITSAIEKDKSPESVIKNKKNNLKAPVVATVSASEALLFNEDGIAEVILSKPKLTETEIKARIQEFLENYYMQVRILENAPDYSSITVEGSHWDVFNRKSIASRNPIINARYYMTLTTMKDGVKVTIQHIAFEVDVIKYYLDLSDLLNDKPSVITYKEDKPAFLASSSKVVKSLDYYLDNGEIKYFDVSSQ